jgi:hypothetical protein
VADEPNDLELKFDGPSVVALRGAPVEAVIASLTAIQRMVHIIGMQAEGRVLSERLKPTSKVKRDYTVVCRAPKFGSHIQPFTVESSAGGHSNSSLEACEKLLATLRAFDSGEESNLENVIPNARERWFLAKAACGLLPPEHSDLQVMIRSGSHGPFAFKADRARKLLSTYNTPHPPEIDEETITGKLRAIDYGQTIMTIKPGNDPALRMDYPLPLEDWLQSNVRKRLSFTGRPKVNAKGDISGFDEIFSVTELEPHLEPIDRFESDGSLIGTNRPLSMPITVLWPERLFAFVDIRLGLDVVVQDVKELRKAVLSELDLVWSQYAAADDDKLDDEAQSVKRVLLLRFGPIDQ